MTTSISVCLPAVRCRGSCIPVVSPWTRLVILDRVEQLGNVLLSGLIHLDHCSLHTDTESAIIFFSILARNEKYQLI